MKKILLSVFLLTAIVSFAQEPQKSKKVPQDTTKVPEVPVKITPQQTDIEPEKMEKRSGKVHPKKEIPSEGPKKKPRGN